MLAGLEELNLLTKTATPAPVFVVQFLAERLGDYQRLARMLRAAGIGVEVFPEAKKIGQQLQYAEKRGFRLALIAGSDEFAQGVWKIKDLARREEKTVPEAQVVAALPLTRSLEEEGEKRRKGERETFFSLPFSPSPLSLAFTFTQHQIVDCPARDPCSRKAPGRPRW